MDAVRKIIHIDMDAFYAAVEQRDDPRLRGRPVVVGGSPDSRGVVATASYEARQFGIHSAMPASRAQRLCPEAVFLRPRFAAYRAISLQIRQLFQQITAVVEPLSLDEAYLDVSRCRFAEGSATRIAAWLKRRIGEETGLIASAGVSYNKFLAKLASDMDKPDGLRVILPAEGPALVEKLAIGQFHGIGRATAARLQALGIHTGADLRAKSLAQLQTYFGRRAQYYYDLARAVDERSVAGQRPRKSLGTELTFPTDMTHIEAMQASLERLATEVIAGLDEHALWAQTLTLKVKYADFQSITRSMTPGYPLHALEQILPLLYALLERTEAHRRPVRLLGVTAAGLLESAGQTPVRQLDLFGD